MRAGSVGKTFAVVTAACAFALSGCGTDSSAATESGTGYVAGDGSTVVLDAAERSLAPEISGKTLDGGTWSSADALGDVTVLNVWASWCAPCRAEAPALQRSYESHLDQGVQFVGINTRDTDAAANAFVARYGITYPNLVDPDGQVQLQLRDSLPPQSIPSTLFLDKQGRVAARVLGEIDPTRLDGIIDTLVNEP
ncbi:MAG: TlpA family protein disulfide reductase [Actinobacteria bacterium]|nr:TlpA family protein disulfide reductase [Actinomycetota bacterium]